jgi:hypothetical protein
MGEHAGLAGACSSHDQKWAGGRRRREKLEGIEAEQSLSEPLLVYDIGTTADQQEP